MDAMKPMDSRESMEAMDFRDSMASMEFMDSKESKWSTDSQFLEFMLKCLRIEFASLRFVGLDVFLVSLV